ncbi:hypothetical protein GOC74_08105 [Halomicrobium mukohataei]|uniref:DUF4184 family protein n=1 Tax=Halomicrobium mukohataei TaxID=57705 RepID=A0A847UEH6_9EURY|nr:hypothetical protein [Halomicrobium mukohataei]NLV09890.1 hypothetical protein [Halomicrobium mukohataei]
MPLTPFHLGPALLAGVVLYRFLDLPTVLAGSVVVDVRAALVVFGPLDEPIHGVLTTFVGATAVTLTLTVVVLALPDGVQSLLDIGRLAPTTSLGPVLAGAFVGTWSHVVLDSLLYADARPLFPLAENPLLREGVAFGPVYGGCLVAGLFGLAGYVFRRRQADGIRPVQRGPP